MTTVSAATSVTSAQQAPRASGTLVNSDFQTFLKMLTTQARNQDPLNPIDSSDYAQQLATFSGVEQQVRTNTILESLAAQLGSSGLGQFAGWVGMEARVTAPVPFDGTPLTLFPSSAVGADRAVLLTLDAAGQEIARSAAPLGSAPALWAGTGADGQPLPSGLYSFRLESYDGDQLLEAAAVPSYGRITEVRSGAAGPLFTLAGGAEIGVADITGLREEG